MNGEKYYKEVSFCGGIWESEVGDKQAMRKHERAVAVVREINTVKEFIKENLFCNGIRKWP